MLPLKTLVKDVSNLAAKHESRLKRLGIVTVKDLLWHLPIRYDDFSKRTTVSKISVSDQAVIVGELTSVAARRGWKSRKNITEAIIADETGSLKAVWFNQPYLTHVLKPGQKYYFIGKAVDYYGLTLSNPTFERFYEGEASLHFKNLTPVYPTTQKLTQKLIRFFIKSALEKQPAIKEYLPPAYLARERMLALPQAAREVHFPTNKELLGEAIERLKFEELYQLQRRILKTKNLLKQKPAYAITGNDVASKKFIGRLPFSLTSEQWRAAMEISHDMRRAHPMNRILVGEVGSGKTVVAAMAVLATVMGGGAQAAMMAPTEILARQHFDTFVKLFGQFDISIYLLTRSYKLFGLNGRTKETTAVRVKKNIAQGNADLVIGTHALIQPSVRFSKLALAVVDEQHRFGVRTRALLAEQGTENILPHFLSLTATPIPRTQAQLLYADLDVSVLATLPPGRKQVVTKLVKQNELPENYTFMAREISQGRQMFVICPLILESDVLGVEAVVTEEQKIKPIFKDCKIAILHGRLTAGAKEKVMADFNRGKIHILISTSVVEVGIDVPNASLMMIESPERFGLAQLHQLRGRIGRGEHQSYCLVVLNAEESGLVRLKQFVKIKNGFELAKKDLLTRGPGELYGLRQSGFLNLKIASLEDLALMKKIRAYLEV